MAILTFRDDPAGETEYTEIDSQHPLPVKTVADPQASPALGLGATGFRYQNITTQATTTVKTGAGVLHSININKPLAAGVVTIYDNVAGNGNIIGTITFPATLLNAPAPYLYDVYFQEGLTIVTSGATQDITVAYI